MELQQLGPVLQKHRRKQLLRLRMRWKKPPEAEILLQVTRAYGFGEPGRLERQVPISGLVRAYGALGDWGVEELFRLD